MQDRFEKYRRNVNEAMLECLADEFGLSVEAIKSLPIGWYPAKDAWVFAERNHKGAIIGLSYRKPDGFKFMAKGSKRGLIYPYTYEGGNVAKGKSRWVRVYDAGVSCPICGKPDWCRVSPDNPEDPAAVLCSRVKDGCDRVISENNYLHIRDAKRNADIIGSLSILPDTDLPILIVEGASDVMAAAELGFVAIGKPSAKGGLKELAKMPLIDKRVIVIGENDAGAGREGMEKTFLNLRKDIKYLSKLMPPKGIKDLRSWVADGLTTEEFLSYSDSRANTQEPSSDPDILEDDIAFNILRRFLTEKHMTDNVVTLRLFGGHWYSWDGGKYRELDGKLLSGQLYRWLDGKKYMKITKDGYELSPYKPTRAKIADILDACSAFAPVPAAPPVWVDGGDHLNVNDLIVFKNGMLDINEYFRGNVVMHDPDPRLFNLDCIPYDYDSNADSDLAREYLDMTFNGDEGRIELAKQWLGYNLVADTSMEKLMLFTGPPRSGKSTLIEMMQGMLGKDRCCSADFSMLAAKHGTSTFIGKSSVIMGDTKTPKVTEANAAMETLLKIVGQDDVSVEPKWVQPFTTRLKVKFTIAMNDLPVFDDFAFALQARLNVLYFPNSMVGKEDYTLKPRLAREAKAGKLVNMALEGLKSLREKGLFAMPESSITVLDQFRELSSPVSAFVASCCLVSPDKAVTSSDIFAAWRGWCKENSCSHGNSAVFGRHLFHAVPGISKRRLGSDGDRRYVYTGIDLTEWTKKYYLGKP